MKNNNLEIIKNIVADPKQKRLLDDEKIDWLIQQAEQVEILKKELFNRVTYCEWGAIISGEYEKIGFKTVKHELNSTKGWWDIYDVEFYFFDEKYGFQYRIHKSNNVSESDLTQPIKKINEERLCVDYS